MKPYWQGVFPAVTTQLAQDESLDLPATARHLEVLLESGVAGVIMLGSLGENQALSSEEKRQVVRCAVETVAGRAPVLSGVAETSTEAACHYARACEELGADGLMLMPPMVYKGDPSETMTFARTVAGATGLPIMVYNNPVSYGNDLTPARFAELAAVKNLVALKESSGDSRRVTDLRNTVGDRYALFVGVDDLALEAAVLGIDGWVAGVGLAVPRENQWFWELTRQGRWEEARAVYRWFTPLLHLDTHPKFVHYIKLAIQEAGLGREWVRRPRLPLVGEERSRILRIIRQALAARPAIPPRTQSRPAPVAPPRSAAARRKPAA